MEIKEMFDDLNATFDKFKKANDAALAAKADKGHVDALLEEKVKKVNDDLSEKQATYQNQLDEFQAQINRLDVLESTGKEPAAVIKEAEVFSKITGRPVTAESYIAYQGAFNQYMRLGNQGMITPELQAALSVGSDPKGGYYVTADTNGKIVQLIFETSPIRSIADSMTIGTDALEGRRDLDEAAQGWVGERQSRPETNTPDIGSWRIPVHEQYAMPKATQKLLDDASIDVEAWLSGKVADKLVRSENVEFVNGIGSLRPRGFLTYPEGTPTAADYEKVKQIASGKSADFKATDPGDKLLDMVFDLKAAYRANARWVMSRLTLGATRKLKDGQGNYLWLPGTFADQAISGTLLGFPVTEAEDMPEIAANSLSIAFADWKKAYLIVDRQGIRVIRDNLTDKPNILFYTTKRVGGDVSDFDAIKLMKFAVSV